MKEKREILKQIDERRQTLNGELGGLDQDYQQTLWEYLEIEPGSALALADVDFHPFVASDILEFVEEQNLNPSWFTAEITKATTAVQGFSPDMTYSWGGKGLPIAETEGQFINCAIHNIRSQTDNSKHGDRWVTEALKKAAELVTPPLAKTYGWINDNRDLLYEAHGKYWKENYRKNADQLRYGWKPEELEPKELTPILESEIESLPSRKVFIEMINEEAGRKLKDYMESVGYEVTTHYPHYEPGEYRGHAIFTASIGMRSNFITHRDCMEYIQNQQKQFEERLDEVLTDAQKQNIDLYRRFLNPVTTPLTLGTHNLYPQFIDNKIVYLQGVEVGFNMEEAVRLVDFATDHLDTHNDVNVFLGGANQLRKDLTDQQDPQHSINHYLGQVRDTLRTFLQTDIASVLERPTKLKQLYEEKAYRIYALY